ncbi:50S ribosomal protein L11 methyltransferase [Salinispirillum sp. LH 10-3-1]|uniref:Ribosomal protein L11 methyltransferase n=1 Tax=Salinispirillum sp. LH 10-3-1 TaxID=2952525 RepID=A0AB38YII5_9GAMM
MAWLKIQLHDISPQSAESYEDALLSLGAQVVTLEDGADEPIFEPELGTTPLWQNSRLTALFAADVDAQLVILAFTDLMQRADVTVPSVTSDLLEDKDWIRAWMDSYHPIQFGKRLWICPSWHTPPQPDAVNLMLDPGLAFGTGTHQTTALCMRWLDGLDLHGKRIVDYGCGSGILGLAGILLGAHYMMGVDIDPQALYATRQNAERNNITAAQYDVYLPEDTPALQADVLVANILAGPLIQLRDQILAHLKPGAQLALSGIIKNQVDDVVAAYAPLVSDIEIAYDEDWARITGHRS